MLSKYLLVFSILFLLLTSVPTLALDVPKLAGRVNDYAGLLSPDVKATLEKKLDNFEKEQSTQIVVLTISSLQGDIIEQFAIRVAEQWKLGQKGKDNGVLLILARDERKVRIEVGMGLQGVLPDISASHIIRDVMRPFLQKDDYDRGISAGIDAILAATSGEFKATAKVKASQKQHSSSPSPVTLFLLAVVAILILGTFSRYLGGLTGSAVLPLAAWFGLPGVSLLTIVILAAAGFIGGLLLSMLLSGIFGGSGGYFGGGWGGGFFGGGGFGGGGSSSNNDEEFSGGGGDFDGGGSSDDY